MKRHKLLTLLGSMCLIITLVAILSPAPVTARAAEAKSKPIELKMVTFLPAHLGKVKIQLTLKDRINEQAKGELTIKYLGSRDIMNPKEMGMAVKNGVIDIAVIPASYYSGLVPAGDVFLLSRLSVEEERRPGGFLDYQRELHKKAGLFLLGRANPLEKGAYFFYCFTNKKVRRLKDLAGQKISTGVMGVPFIKALGATPFNLSKGEVYTALQQGIIDGNLDPIDQIFGPGLHRVVKHMIDHGFSGAGQNTIINLDKWNMIPKHLQETILKTQLEMEKVWPKLNTDLLRTHRQKLVKAGMEFVQFSPEEGARFVDLYYSSVWEYMIKQFPEEAKKSKELLGE